MSAINRRRVLTALGTAPLVGTALLSREPAQASGTVDRPRVEISGCARIDEPGDYVLTGDIETEDAYACIEIRDTDDVTLDGNGHEITGQYVKGIYVHGSSNVVIHNTITEGAEYSGIFVENSDNIVLRDNISRHNLDNSIHILESQQLEVFRNDVEDSKGTGISFWNSRDGRAYDNVVTGSPGEKDDVGGINTWNSSNITIENNSVDGHQYGINVRDESTDILVRSNEVTNSVLCAMDAKSGSGNVVFEENYLVDHEGIGLENGVNNVTIRNNVIKDSRGDEGGDQFQAAIHIVQSSHDIEVYGNEIINSDKDGIQIAGWDETVYDVTVYDNTITNVEDHGIQVASGAHDIRISDNRIQENARDGITVWDSEDLSVTGNEITRNHGAGVRISESRNLQINHNRIFENAAGVVADEHSTNIDAANNWWGHNSGPSGAGPGTGDSVSGNLVFEPWLELDEQRPEREDTHEDEDDEEEQEEVEPDGQPVDVGEEREADVELPGFGIGAGIAGIAGGVYLLKRYVGSTDSE